MRSGLTNNSGYKNVVKKRYLMFAVVAIGLILGSPRLFAQSSQNVNWAWAPGPGRGVPGSVVNYGETSGSYPNTTNLPNQTPAQVTGLQSGQTYSFVVWG